ncbi:MAG: hypothetical protein QOJ85_4788 [Solirubrobacteraceae bacterium]|nr:hypothetical protein [Solirubrobacteraceae bacterium]
MRDDVNGPERRHRLVEQPLDVELVGDVGAHGERGGAGSEDLVHDGVGLTRVAEVGDDDGEAPPRELTRELAAGS